MTAGSRLCGRSQVGGRRGNAAANKSKEWMEKHVHPPAEEQTRQTVPAVKALVRTVNDLRTFTSDGEEFLSVFRNKKGQVQQVIAGDITSALKAAAAKKEYPARQGLNESFRQHKTACLYLDGNREGGGV